MMYLLTMGWFLAHTSLAMTPEHSATNGEYSSLRSARAGPWLAKAAARAALTGLSFCHKHCKACGRCANGEGELGSATANTGNIS